MEKETSIILMEISIKVSGSMIRLVVVGYILMKMEPCMKENGKTKNKMDMELRIGPMERYIKVNIKMEPKQVKVFSNLSIKAIMKANS